MDKFIIRFTAFVVNLYIPIVLIFAFNGIDVSDYDYIFSSSFLLGLILIILSHSQGKYHCVWVRGLCYNSAAVPVVGFIDSQYILFEDAMTFIYLISVMWSLSVLSTIILAINHFRKVRKLKKQQHELRRRNKRQDR